MEPTDRTRLHIYRYNTLIVQDNVIRFDSWTGGDPAVVEVEYGKPLEIIFDSRIRDQALGWINCGSEDIDENFAEKCKRKMKNAMDLNIFRRIHRSLAKSCKYVNRK
jgi:hypothetical protein